AIDEARVDRMLARFETSVVALSIDPPVTPAAHVTAAARGIVTRKLAVAAIVGAASFAAGGVTGWVVRGPGSAPSITTSAVDARPTAPAPLDAAIVQPDAPL